MLIHRTHTLEVVSRIQFGNVQLKLMASTSSITSFLRRDNKDMKSRQTKISMESSKSLMGDKNVKNKAERDRSLALKFSHFCIRPSTCSVEKESSDL